MIEEEKENTEQRAEETESREGRGGLGSLRRFKSVSSLNLHPASSGAGSVFSFSSSINRIFR